LVKKYRSTHHFDGRQMTFDFSPPKEHDRNFHLGGRSFYFFDFDDNLVFLLTPVVLFHKFDGSEIELSSGDFAKATKEIGKTGSYKDYYIDFNDETGTFRYCRDIKLNDEDVLKGKKQRFILDIEEALNHSTHVWKAPSWSSFYHATYNHRPVSIITARGHKKETIEHGIDLLVKKGHLPHTPNYLSIFPVSNLDTKKELGDLNFTKDIAELKKLAIRKSVEMAIETYGHSPFHRFGMSDDDYKNIELITEEMRSLKINYPKMTFFVIETKKDSYAKYEILAEETREIVSFKESKNDQLTLF
jgi:hypothetical protein